MNRDEIRDRFSALLDDELSQEERAEIEAVLAQDAELLRELDSLKRVDVLYRELPKAEAPEGFESGVSDRIRSPRIALATRHTRRRLWPSLAAAAMLLVTAGFVIYQTRDPRAGFDIASTDTASAPAVSRGTAPMQQETLLDQDLQQLQSLGYAGAASEAAASEPAPATPMFKTDSPDIAADSATPERRMEQQAAPAPPPRSIERFRADNSDNGLAKEKDEAVGVAAPMIVAEELAPATTATPSPPASAPQESAPPAGKPVELEKKAIAGRAMADESASSLRAAAPPKEKRRLADRDFDLRDGVLYQTGYNGEPTVPIVRGTTTASELMTKHEGIEELFNSESPIVFKAGDRWYKLTSPER